MYNNKNDFRRTAPNRAVIEYLRMGVSSLRKHPAKILLSILYWLLIPCVILNYELWFSMSTLETKLYQPIMYILFPIAAFLVYLSALTVSVIPRHATQLSAAFLQSGITNSAGEPPVPCESSDTRLVVQTAGISPELFESKSKDLEAALNKCIVRISEGEDKQHLIIHLAPGDAKLPDKVDLDLNNMPENESVLALGETQEGQLCIDLQTTPHLLCGASSGGGKTMFLLSLIAQALAKRMQVYIFDMKGGVDFPRDWRESLCDFSDDPAMILSELSYLVRELNVRIEKFKGIERLYGTACPNLQTYNRLCKEEKLARILIIFDELAMITDTTGLDKDHKARAATIIAHLSDIARLGRAFGIHLIIATQRPDANAVPGQVKNNCDVRIAGRSDLVLSQILLDNGDASHLPKDKPGRFITNIDGSKEFQGYYVDVRKIS